MAGFETDPYLSEHPQFPRAREILLKYLGAETIPHKALRQGYASQHSIRMHSALRALVEALSTELPPATHEGSARAD